MLPLLMTIIGITVVISSPGEGVASPPISCGWLCQWPELSSDLLFLRSALNLLGHPEHILREAQN